MVTSATNMAMRTLGSKGPKVSEISYGLMGVGGGITYYEESMKEPAEKAMEMFLQKGGNHGLFAHVASQCHAVDTASFLSAVDTSDAYGFGASEVFLGEQIKKYGRDKFFVATKMSLASPLSADDRIKNWGAPCLDPAYVKEACEQSLSRLGIACIDLFYFHRMDPKTEIEASMEAAKQLVVEGKIK